MDVPAGAHSMSQGLRVLVLAAPAACSLDCGRSRHRSPELGGVTIASGRLDITGPITEGRVLINAALSDCPLLGRTGHAGMACCTLTTATTIRPNATVVVHAFYKVPPNRFCNNSGPVRNS